VTLPHPLPASAPLVIGHRGAPGYRPEHTLASYELAARLGADHIEPDLVITADGVLVSRHEPEIGATTDVAEHPEFAERRTTKSVDGAAVTGWFVEDFTLAELKTLRARERIPRVRPENTLYDGRFEVPTFAEVLQLRARLSDRLGREIGVYPETKHPTYFAAHGTPLEPPLVAALRAAGLDRPDAPVFVQSFVGATLRALRGQVRVLLVQLLGPASRFDAAASPAGLAEIATYADAVGPHKNRVIARNATGALAGPTPLVADAHAAGLLVHAYTFRNENAFLPTELRSSHRAGDHGAAVAEYEAFLRAGVDGVFSDNPDTAVAARAALLTAAQ
jgi:glycerophosphoryl diester phosphodiesterase